MCLRVYFEDQKKHVRSIRQLRECLGISVSQLAWQGDEEVIGPIEEDACLCGVDLMKTLAESDYYGVWEGADYQCMIVAKL